MTSLLLRRPLVELLAGRDDAVALVDGSGPVTYADLAAAVAGVADRLGTARRLVAVEGTSTVAALTGYLGALAARCPLLLLPPGDLDDPAGIAAAYDPDVVLHPDGRSVQVAERRAEPAHDLHPDLALLLSTSGSSGSPKLVRLSYDNLLANAASIVEAVGVRADDRAATTLPLHYCYGLSVVNSHLLAGAALVLTDLSVVDACFWDLARRTGVTTLAAVPYTFDLLDRVGFDGTGLPTLRCITQAGGRLAPDRVRHWARTGARAGWDLVVMYGQTEATARMAVLPPALAEQHPQSVGRPVPGGAFELDPVEGAGEGVGELVYTGPNVMLGYATSPQDLALGRTVERLRTGDLARRGPDGLYEVVGRRSRVAKAYGLRLDLEHVESRFAAAGLVAACEPAGDGLGVLVEGHHDADRLRALLGEVTGLPVHALRAACTDRLPRTPAGKVDARAVRDRLERARPAGPAATGVRGVYADVLGVVPGDGDTFVGLGGDSLSYVEVSVRLEEVLPSVPAGWHVLPVAELEASATGPAAPVRRRLDTSVALRAVAIVLIVGSHADLFFLQGGAHLLLVVAGWNFARFHVRSERRERRRSVLRSLARVVVPTCAWLAVFAAVTRDFGLPTVLLVNHALGPPRFGPEWRLWFVEAFVALLVAAVLLLSVPAVDRFARRHGFALAAGLVGLGLLVRYGVLDVPTGPSGRFTPQAVLWLFALGWAGALAATRRQRLLVSAVAVVAVADFFGRPSRELVVAGGALLLLHVARVPSTRLLNRVAGVLAGSSLYVYVTHWQVYPHLEDRSPLLAVLASFAVGLAYQQVAERATARAEQALRRRRA